MKWQHDNHEGNWRDDILKESAEIARAEEEKKPGPKAVRPKNWWAKKKKRRRLAAKSRRRNRK